MHDLSRAVPVGSHGRTPLASRRTTSWCLGLGVCWISLLCAPPAEAHLMVTEVGYDTVDETAPTSEFLEIWNPGPAPVSLADVWVANDEEAYPLLVNGPISSGITLLDFVYRFPDITLPPGRVLVVCQDSDAFLAEHFAGLLSGFTSLPGSPLLVEVTDDGVGDGVPGMLDWGSNEAGTLSMANNGECVGLVTWDGASDRIEDLDWVCWLTMNNVPNKDVDYPFGIDGPDPDLDSSWFVEDLGTGIPAPDAPEGMSIHRASASEPGEAATGGNGVGGHDETSEDWSSWDVAPYSPGVAGFGSVDVPASRGGDLRLKMVGANPFQGQARLAFELPHAGNVRLLVVDLAGRRVATVADGERGAGLHLVTWDGRGDGGEVVRHGVYFARLSFERDVRSLTLVLIR